MNCSEYKHRISLFLYEELPESEKPGFESHLQACEACRHIFEEEKGLHFVLAEDAVSWDLPSDLLVESRRELANELDQIERKRPWWRIPAFSVVFTPMRLLESAALVAMGLALGVYFTNQQHTAAQVASVPQEPASIVSTLPANGSVSNLRIVSANPLTGQVELAGEIVQPLRMSGSMGDDNVRQLLVSALGGSTNSGSRLRAVEVLSRHANNEMVRGALIRALMYDENPGLRLRAIQGLKPFAGEADVQAAFLYSLSNDMESGIRVEAIEALTHNGANNSLIQALEPFTRDDNSFIRMKSLQLVGTKK